ncbi:MAG: helix-turn-helix domain-containing protein [Pseudomonadota bacterium]
MKWEDVSDTQCSIARSSAVLSDRWTLLILSDFFLGVRRFEMFQQRLGMSRTTLANRLTRLEEHGVVRLQQYQTNPDRYEYRLTAKGLDLHPVIATIVGWGDKHYAGEDGPPIIHQHKTCGADIHAVLACPECGETIGPSDIVARAREDAPGRPSVERRPVVSA